MDVVQQLPSEASASGDLARAIARILGPAYQPADGTTVGDDFLSLGDILRDSRQTNTNSINEAFANTANQLLAEFESVFGLPTDATLTQAQREQRIVAKIQALRAGTPQGIIAAINNLLSSPPATITENLASTVAALSPPNPRGVYAWALVISASDWSNTATLTAARAIIEQMKPAFTRGTVTTRVGFRVDDPLSLVDRDVLRI